MHQLLEGKARRMNWQGKAGNKRKTEAGTHDPAIGATIAPRAQEGLRQNGQISPVRFWPSFVPSTGIYHNNTTIILHRFPAETQRE